MLAIMALNTVLFFNIFKLCVDMIVIRKYIGVVSCCLLHGFESSIILNWLLTNSRESSLLCCLIHSKDIVKYIHGFFKCKVNTKCLG